MTAVVRYLYQDGANQQEIFKVKLSLWSVLGTRNISSIKDRYFVAYQEHNQSKLLDIKKEANQHAFRLWQYRFPTKVNLELKFVTGDLGEVEGFAAIIGEVWDSVTFCGAGSFLNEVLAYQRMIISRCGPAADMMSSPHNRQVPAPNTWDIMDKVKKWVLPGLTGFKSRELGRHPDRIIFHGYILNAIPFEYYSSYENGYDWWPTHATIKALFEDAPKEPKL